MKGSLTNPNIIFRYLCKGFQCTSEIICCVKVPFHSLLKCRDYLTIKRTTLQFMTGSEDLAEKASNGTVAFLLWKVIFILLIMLFILLVALQVGG